jgi:hypothetical protein
LWAQLCDKETLHSHEWDAESMPKVWTQTTALIRLLVTVYCEQKLKHLLGKREKQEHKVMRQLEHRGSELQPEYHRPTPECAHPERWYMRGWCMNS